MQFEEHDGTISDFGFESEKYILLASSNDGYLSVYDLRKGIL